MSSAEGAAAFDAWMHEQGYTYHGDAPITGLTAYELDKLQLGFAVIQERKQDAAEVDMAGGSYSDRRKVSHQRDINRRLRKMEVKRGRKRRAREHFAKERDL